MKCPSCGGTATVEREKSPHVGVYCTCGKWLRWSLKPMTLERARAFLMPFGKHVGSSLDTLPDDYLSWMSRNSMNKRIRTASKLVLEAREGQT